MTGVMDEIWADEKAEYEADPEAYKARQDALQAEMAAARAERLAKERDGWGGVVVPVEMVFRLPHLLLAATVAEESGKAKGSTKLRGLGIPLPFTDTDGSVTVVRLWATWAKRRGGSAKLVGFQVRMGQTRSGKWLKDFRIREHDGALVSTSFYPALEQDLAHLVELSRQMIEAEAAGRHEDPLAVLARNVVAQARATFCACCGRLLTDPVSVESGIGPECGATFQVAFRARWRSARGAH